MYEEQDVLKYQVLTGGHSQFSHLLTEIQFKNKSFRLALHTLK